MEAEATSSAEAMPSQAEATSQQEAEIWLRVAGGLGSTAEGDWGWVAD
jgi:hypothetical protein